MNKKIFTLATHRIQKLLMDTKKTKKNKKQTSMYQQLYTNNKAQKYTMTNQMWIKCRWSVWRWAILESKLRGWSEKKVEYHLHKGDG